MLTMPKAGRICCVPGCENTPESANKFAGPLKFYKFPNAGLFTAWRQEKRQQWIDAVAIKNQDGSPWQPTKNTVICSLHFVGGEKSEDPRGPSYIPTLFPISYGTLNVSKTSKRIVRILKKTDSKVTSDTEMPLNPAANLPEGASVSNAEMTPTLDIVKEEFLPSTSEIRPEITGIFMYDFKNILPSTKSVECQANLLPDKQSSESNCFVCHMTVENNVCTAETQVYIASKVDRETDCNVSRDLMNRRDVACGPSIYEHNESQIVRFQGITSIKNENELIDLCGVPFATFDLLLSLLPDMPGKKLNAKNKLLIFLMKLKLGLSSTVLAVLFSVHRTTVWRIFLDILQCLPSLLEEHVYWPTKQTVQKSLPQVFKTNYPNCRVIMDCIETRVEAPSNPEERKLLYSNREETFTKKFLFAFTPNGFICFKSKFYGGGTTDEFIANDSEFLDFIESGDLVIADERFAKADFKKCVAKKKADFLVIPFIEDPEVSLSKVEESRKLAPLRNQVKRCIQRLKTFEILSFLSNDMLPYANTINHVCCSLVNIQLPKSQSK